MFVRGGGPAPPASGVEYPEYFPRNFYEKFSEDFSIISREEFSAISRENFSENPRDIFSHKKINEFPGPQPTGGSGQAV